MDTKYDELKVAYVHESDYLHDQLNKQSKIARAKVAELEQELEVVRYNEADFCY